MAEIQPSLRDSMSLFDNPTLERVGYSQISLRETPDEQPLLFEERGAKKCPNFSIETVETVSMDSDAQTPR